MGKDRNKTVKKRTVCVVRRSQANEPVPSSSSHDIGACADSEEPRVPPLPELPLPPVNHRDRVPGLTPDQRKLFEAIERRYARGSSGHTKVLHRGDSASTSSRVPPFGNTPDVSSRPFSDTPPIPLKQTVQSALSEFENTRAMAAQATRAKNDSLFTFGHERRLPELTRWAIPDCLTADRSDSASSHQADDLLPTRETGESDNSSSEESVATLVPSDDEVETALECQTGEDVDRVKGDELPERAGKYHKKDTGLGSVDKEMDTLTRAFRSIRMEDEETDSESPPQAFHISVISDSTPDNQTHTGGNDTELASAQPQVACEDQSLAEVVDYPEETARKSEAFQKMCKNLLDRYDRWIEEVTRRNVHDVKSADGQPGTSRQFVVADNVVPIIEALDSAIAMLEKLERSDVEADDDGVIQIVESKMDSLVTSDKVDEADKDGKPNKEEEVDEDDEAGEEDKADKEDKAHEDDKASKMDKANKKDVAKEEDKTNEEFSQIRGDDKSLLLDQPSSYNQSEDPHQLKSDHNPNRCGPSSVVCSQEANDQQKTSAELRVADTAVESGDTSVEHHSSSISSAKNAADEQSEGPTSPKTASSQEESHAIPVEDGQPAISHRSDEKIIDDGLQTRVEDSPVAVAAVAGFEKEDVGDSICVAGNEIVPDVKQAATSKDKVLAKVGKVMAHSEHTKEVGEKKRRPMEPTESKDSVENSEMDQAASVELTKFLTGEGEHVVLAYFVEYYFDVFVAYNRVLKEAGKYANDLTRVTISETFVETVRHACYCPPLNNCRDNQCHRLRVVIAHWSKWNGLCYTHECRLCERVLERFRKEKTNVSELLESMRGEAKPKNVRKLQKQLIQMVQKPGDPPRKSKQMHLKWEDSDRVDFKNACVNACIFADAEYGEINGNALEDLDLASLYDKPSTYQLLMLSRYLLFEAIGLEEKQIFDGSPNVAAYYRNSVAEGGTLAQTVHHFVKRELSILDDTWANGTSFVSNSSFNVSSKRYLLLISSKMKNKMIAFANSMGR